MMWVRHSDIRHCARIIWSRFGFCARAQGVLSSLLRMGISKLASPSSPSRAGSRLYIPWGGSWVDTNSKALVRPLLYLPLGGYDDSYVKGRVAILHREAFSIGHPHAAMPQYLETRACWMHLRHAFRLQLGREPLTQHPSKALPIASAGCEWRRCPRVRSSAPRPSRPR